MKPAIWFRRTQTTLTILAMTRPLMICRVASLFAANPSHQVTCRTTTLRVSSFITAPAASSPLSSRDFHNWFCEWLGARQIARVTAGGILAANTAG
jgi:hypothetical protein